MRTIRRISRNLNKGKWQALQEIARRYAAEKQAHLPYFTDVRFVACPSDRTRRDELVKSGYRNQSGLQARQWKLALKEAYETVLKQWAALAADLKPRIAAHKQWSEAQQHYAYWLLTSPQRLAQLVCGKAPLPAHFAISLPERRTVQNYLRRVIRRRRGSRPCVRKARSFALDADMYDLFEQEGVQYIRVMSLIPRQRIVIPLAGRTPVSGNIRLVLDSDRQRVEIHYTAPLNASPETDEPEADEAVCALDAGLSEVFIDELGHRYGEGFGEFIGQASEGLTDKGRKRNKLHQLAKKAQARGDQAKAKRIRQFNLGQKKLRRQARKRKVEMERQFNTALNQVVEKRQPRVVVTEKLDFRGKAKSKKISRRVSLWARRVLKERVQFKASAEGFRREQVNPAYSSQTCPLCGFVHPDNRCGDTFQCLRCGHRDHSDRVAATNHKARRNDPDITLFTPKGRVKDILLARYHARLESLSARGDCFGADSRHSTLPP
ncbi:MAG: transposase [Anaerolineae bacterium]|nr:transposase [Anaerolineae bacterium]